MLVANGDKVVQVNGLTSKQISTRSNEMIECLMQLGHIITVIRLHQVSTADCS